MHFTNFLSNLTLILCFIASLLTSVISQARPEYAAREKNSCTSCHVNVTGGGPRTIGGKAYGSRGIGFAKTSQKDWFYGDFRGISFRPKGKSERTSNFAIMKATASLNVNILEGENNSKLKAVATTNFATGPFATKGNARELYFSWDNGKKNSPFRYLTVGRFYLPFGLLTDEHRTYNRIQTGHTFRDFEAGLMVSADFGDFHYDFSLTEGHNGSSFSESGTPLVSTLNLRYNPEDFPMMFGLSGIYEDNSSKGSAGTDNRLLKDTLPWAISFYNVLVFDKISEKSPKISLSTEVVLAKNYNRTAYNGTLAPYVYTGNPVFQAATENAKSLGLLAELKWEFTNKLIGMYKFEQLTLNQDFSSDRFIRHGLGFRYQFSSNAMITLKYEVADLGRNDLLEDDLRAAEDAWLGVFRVWL